MDQTADQLWTGPHAWLFYGPHLTNICEELPRYIVQSGISRLGWWTDFTVLVLMSLEHRFNTRNNPCREVQISCELMLGANYWAILDFL